MNPTRLIGAPANRRRLGLVGALVLLLGPILGLAAPQSASASEADSGSNFSIGGGLNVDDEPVEGAEILVQGPDGFSETATTDEEGRWRVDVPVRAEYTVTLNVDTLPEGVGLVEADGATRTATFSVTSFAAVTFALGTGDQIGSGGPAAADEFDLGRFLNVLLERFIYGINFGLLLALAAIGITLIFGTTGINNFAHGEMLTFGAVVLFGLWVGFGWNPWLAVVVTLVLSALFGYLQEALIFRPLRRKGVGLVQVLIVTIGLSIAFRYVIQMFFGGGTRTYPVTQLIDLEPIDIGPARIAGTSLISMGISIVVLVLVGLFLTRTRIGKATRAVSDNASLAAASGINVDRIIWIVWTIAGTLTGLSGILYGIYRGLSWDMGFAILLLLFAAVTIGGLGSPFGAGVGALFIGIATEVSTALGVPNELRFAVGLVALIIVLIVRPQGFLGLRERVG